VRAYATNSAGTTYGEDVTFTTSQLTEPISVFRDDFTDLTQWILYGDPLPLNPSTVYGRTGIFDNNGDPSYNSGAISKSTFEFKNNVKIVSDVYLDLSNIYGDFNSPAIGIANPEIQYWGGYNTSLIFALNFNGTASLAGWYITDTGTLSFGIDNSINADDFVNKWVTLTIEIDNEGIPAFYVNDILLFKGTVPLASSIRSTNLQLWLGHRSAGSSGKAYHDYVEVSYPEVIDHDDLSLPEEIAE